MMCAKAGLSTGLKQEGPLVVTSVALNSCET